MPSWKCKAIDNAQQLVREESVYFQQRGGTCEDEHSPWYIRLLQCESSFPISSLFAFLLNSFCWFVFNLLKFCHLREDVLGTSESYKDM